MTLKSSFWSCVNNELFWNSLGFDRLDIIKDKQVYLPIYSVADIDFKIAPITSLTNEIECWSHFSSADIIKKSFR